MDDDGEGEGAATGCMCQKTRTLALAWERLNRAGMHCLGIVAVGFQPMGGTHGSLFCVTCMLLGIRVGMYGVYMSVVCRKNWYAALESSVLLAMRQNSFQFLFLCVSAPIRRGHHPATAIRAQGVFVV